MYVNINTKEAARKQLIKELKRDLFHRHTGKLDEPTAYHNFLPEAIMDSINEGIDVCYKDYSSTEWDMWGSSNCKDVIEKIVCRNKLC